MKRKSRDRVRKTAVFVVGHKQDRLILARKIYHLYINTSTVFPFQLLPGTPLAALYCAIETPPWREPPGWVDRRRWSLRKLILLLRWDRQRR
jgi:hypothetical protein